MTPDEMREIARRIRERNSRPSGADTVPMYATRTAVHAMATAFDELAEAIDPTPPPARKPFDIEAARARLATNQAMIDELKESQ